MNSALTLATNRGNSQQLQVTGAQAAWQHGPVGGDVVGPFLSAVLDWTSLTNGGSGSAVRSAATTLRVAATASTIAQTVMDFFTVYYLPHWQAPACL